MFGNFVEAELRRVSHKSKTNEEAQRQRQMTLQYLLTDPPKQQVNGGSPQHDPSDPVSPETAKRMQQTMPAVSFKGRQFADPVHLFDGTKKPKAAKHI